MADPARRQGCSGMIGAALLGVLVSPAPAAADDATGSLSSTWSRSLNADGTTSMAVAKRLDDLAGTEFGMSLSLAASSAAAAASMAGAPSAEGTAYAKVPVPSLPAWMLWQRGTIQMQADPAADKNTLVTTLARGWDVAEGVKAALADSYTVTRTGGVQTWETDKALSLQLTGTGTTVKLATKATEGEAGWLPALSAEQALFGGLNVTTRVAETVTTTGTTLNRSITAGFKRSW